MGALQHMRDQQGRAFDASSQLADANAAPLFPTIQVRLHTVACK